MMNLQALESQIDAMVGIAPAIRNGAKMWLKAANNRSQGNADVTVTETAPTITIEVIQSDFTSAIQIYLTMPGTWSP